MVDQNDNKIAISLLGNVHQILKGIEDGKVKDIFCGLHQLHLNASELDKVALYNLKNGVYK